MGPAIRLDFTLLGIETVAQLAASEPDDLYVRLQELTAKDQDPCVWDTFAAAVHQARTGEAMPWWKWTAVRKGRATPIPRPFRDPRPESESPRKTSRTGRTPR